MGLEISDSRHEIMPETISKEHDEEEQSERDEGEEGSISEQW